MSILYIKPTDPAVASLLSATFGKTRLQKVAVHIYTQGGMSLHSYWRGGIRHYHKVVKLDTMEVVDIPENGSGFSRADKVFGSSGIPVSLPAPNYAVVTYTYGYYQQLSIAIHEENATKLIPDKKLTLTWAEQVVLVATRSLKSSYNGRTRAQMAERDTGITPAEWNEAKQSLIAAGFLQKTGAITIEGRNAIASIAAAKSLYALKRGQDDKQ